MIRRCTANSCLAFAGARSVNLDLPLATVLMNPRQEWNLLAFGDNRIRVARELDVDWKKYNQDDYIFSHCSIVASVVVKDDGHTIVPACMELINNNGNAWTNQVLTATFRTFVGGENYLEHCFAAGTRVLMVDGTYKEIQEIQPGEMVINRLGNPSRVKNVQKRWSDSMFKVSSTDILCRDLFVTGNHPFWTFHARETCPKTGRLNLFSRDNDFWQLDSWRGFSRGVYTKKGESFERGITPRWTNVENLDSNRDFVSHPVSDRVVENAEINENRAELIGWFLAEGCYSHVNKFSDDDSGVTFCLGNNEWDVAKRIRNLLEKEFGASFRKDCEPRIYESESGSIIVTLCNNDVAKFFYKWCGKYAWAKKLNIDAMWLPKNLQALILKHCLNGDGTGETKSKGYSIELKSKSLIQQLLFVSWRLGLCPTYRETGVLPRFTDLEIVDGYEVFTEPLTGKKSRPGYGLWFHVRDSKSLNDICGITDGRIEARESKNWTHIFSSNEGRWIVSKIESVIKENVGCDVFNLEVEDDNSYVAEGVVVHNCQVPELSKGKLLDAVLRPVEYVDKKGRKADILFCDILVATARKHETLVNKIASGELTTLSMGCLADYVVCSKCGKVLGDNQPNCKHLEHEMLQDYKDKDGDISRVSELCGRMIKKNGKWEGDPKSVKFIEASWVERPAFTGAVLNHYVGGIPKEAMVMLNFPTAKLAETIEDLFRLRVADKAGMIVLKVARAEMMKRMWDARERKIALSIIRGR